MEMRFYSRATGICLLTWLVCAAFAQIAAARFEAYPAIEPYRGRNAPVILSRRDQTFRTRLRSAASEKPNFAGHYILTAWGCGAECLMGAIIDANTGHVYWLPFTVCCWGANAADDFQPIAFRLDSRLIVFAGQRNEKEGDGGKHYYEIVAGKLKEIRVSP